MTIEQRKEHFKCFISGICSDYRVIDIWNECVKDSNDDTLMTVGQTTVGSDKYFAEASSGAIGTSDRLRDFVDIDILCDYVYDDPMTDLKEDIIDEFEEWFDEGKKETINNLSEDIDNVIETLESIKERIESLL